MYVRSISLRKMVSKFKHSALFFYYAGVFLSNPVSGKNHGTNGRYINILDVSYEEILMVLRYRQFVR